MTDPPATWNDVYRLQFKEALEAAQRAASVLGLRVIVMPQDERPIVALGMTAVEVATQITLINNHLEVAGIPLGVNSVAVRVGLLIDERNSLKDELEDLKAQCESMGILGLRTIDD